MGLNFGYFYRWVQFAFGRWTTTMTEMTTHLADAISELNIAVRVPIRIIIFFSVFSTIVDLYIEVMILTVDFRKLSLIVAFFLRCLVRSTQHDGCLRWFASFGWSSICASNLWTTLVPHLWDKLLIRPSFENDIDYKYLQFWKHRIVFLFAWGRFLMLWWSVLMCRPKWVDCLICSIHSGGF